MVDVTAVAYDAGLRPSEAVMLAGQGAAPSGEGQGRVDVTEADVSFDEPGEPKTGRGSVPIPRHLVELLRGWVDQRGLAGRDLLLRTRAEPRPTSSNGLRAL